MTLWLYQLWCGIVRGHVYDDGPTRPANECFWCGKKKPAEQEKP